MLTAKVAHGILVALAAMQLLCAHAGAASASGNDYDGHFNIVIIHSSNIFAPLIIAEDRHMREALERRIDRGITFFVEALDTLRFDQSTIESEFLTQLRRKYRNQHIDLFLAVGIEALRFAQRSRAEIRPGTPILFYNVATDAIGRFPLEPGVTGALLKYDVAGTLDLAMRLQPRARRIVVVGGQTEFDKDWLRRARETLTPYESKLNVSYLNNLALPEILENLRKLDADTIVIFLTMVRDATGRNYQTPIVAKQVAEASRAPVYGVLETTFGQGIVGGVMASFAVHGTLAGELAARLLAGEKADSIPLQTSSVGPIIDWRQIQRWRLDVERLPPRSVVQFRERTIWQRYAWQISAVAALCLAQTLLISGLLIQRRRRRRAELEVESLAGRLITAQEAERARVARELHDDVNQQLAALSIALSKVKRRLQNGSNATVQEEISRLQQRTIDLAGVIRDLSHDLHPGVLQHAGLGAALTGHCAEVSRQYPIEVTFSAVDLDGIPQDVALCLYRVAQEALRNIVEHAGAHKAQVTLRPREKGLELVIADDGHGFDLAKTGNSGGLGLISLDERVRLVGGSLAISTEPEGGTELRVQVPLEGDRTAAGIA